MAVGLDIGTYTLVCCSRDKDNKLDFSKEINCFIEVPLKDDFLFNMMDTAKVPLIRRPKVAYALGEASLRMAYTIPEIELKRPMKDGCVNPHEKEGFEILKSMIHSLLEDNVRVNNEVLYYSVPANAINEETDANYHSEVLKNILESYESKEGHKVKPHPINEALALIYAELKDKNYTGIGMSFGAGMCNICFAIYGAPVFQFSLVNSGDYLDKMAAKSCGESISFINQEKLKVNLNEDSDSLVHRAIKIQYKLLLDKVMNDIQKGIVSSGKKARLDKPIDIVVAGGVSLIAGFDSMFQKVLKEVELPISVGAIIHPSDALTTVSKGCLIAAENSTQ